MLWIPYLEWFCVCFSFAVSLINTTVNYCYRQFDWILFYSRNIIKIFWLRLNLAEAEPEISYEDKGTILNNVKSCSNVLGSRCQLNLNLQTCRPYRRWLCWQTCWSSYLISILWPVYLKRHDRLHSRTSVIDLTYYWMLHLKYLKR